MIAITIYSKPGCHLCDEMKEVVTRAARGIATIEEIDITTDPDLHSRYGLEIPVLMIDGKKVAKYRVREDDLRRMLMTRLGRSNGPT